MTKKCGIYQIINTINGKIYVGQSTNITERLSDHKSYLRNNKHTNSHLQNSYNKYGEKAFEFKILKVCKPRYLDRFEKLYIRVWDLQNPKKGYNKESGGHLKKTLSKETKQKISKTKQGCVPWNKGKSLPPLSEKTKKKISKKLTGRKLTEEHKRKLSEAKKGLNNPNWKNYARIVKSGFKNGKQSYAVMFDGKRIKQSNYKEKLEKYIEDNFN